MFATSIDELVESLVEFDSDELDAMVRDDELTARAEQARRSIVLAFTENRDVWRRDGHRSMRAHLRATCNWSDGEITRQLRLARLIDRHSSVGDALAAGHIGIPQAMLLGVAFANPRVREFVGASLTLLLDHAEHLPFDDFRTCVDRWVMLADLDGSWRDVEANVVNRSARVSAVGSTVDIAASGGDALTAERLIKIHEAFTQAEFRNDVETRRAEFGDDADQQPLPRTAAQRRFDALQRIFDLAASAAASSDVDVTVPEPTVEIVADAQTVDDTFTREGIFLPTGDVLDLDDLEPHAEQLLRGLATDPASLVDRRSETRSGIPVHPRLLLQALLTARVRRVVIDSQGVVVGRGQLVRLFRGNARQASKVLRRRCSHPGCSVPADRCDVDHMDEWSRDDGPTDQHNADVRCGVHNRFKHRERWRTRRSESGRVISIRPDGTLVLPVGERPPDLTADELARVARRRLRALDDNSDRRPELRTTA